jgi:uncharacterized circularly permuted ATP-grasp superfamily protein/uncharacterized alpha-E superfamily protein
MASETDERPESQPSLIGGYQPASSDYDEMLAQPGLPREHWQPLVRSLEQLDADDFAARGETARRILREHGVSYNVYGDSQGTDRPWAVDLLPLVISATEWRSIESGLIQRTRLLNLLLADLYGPQRLLKEGWIPSALVFANPAFLRPCHGISPPQDIFLFLHAVDLARGADGQWRVLADRTQAPGGIGYVLENRIVVGRVLPNEFRDCQVQRLADFFGLERDTLRSLAPHHSDHPNVILLTPGPYNEAHFEHAFLARYLGFPLVEGGDLTVRDRRVFVKTLEGLQPVDVILRRVDDTFCDPLELWADSILGVPGLLEAARAGNVAIANALGSGAVETPALMAFLPGLCQHLLGEPLQLPFAATWWCGQDQEMQYVLEHLNDLVIKPAFAPGAGEVTFGAKLSARQRASLELSIRTQPIHYVGQEQIALSTAPVWGRRGLEPRPMVLRTYVCVTRSGLTVLPGGLTRVSMSPRDLLVSIQSGGGSKDTWVQADGPINHASTLIPQPQIIRVERTGAEVPSRVADNLFWLGRYAERLEDTVRTLRCLLSRLVGEAGAEETPELNALIRLLVHLDLFPARFSERPRLASVEREVFQLIYQVHRLGTVREVLGRLRQIAFVLRDRFSADTWHIVSQLQVEGPGRTGRIQAAEALSLLNRLILTLAAFSGMEMENMTRGHGWRFLDIGRRLERAVNVSTLLQGAAGVESEGSSVLDPVLEIADSVMTYRRRYFAQPQLLAVLHLLLIDEGNPRSLMFQVNALAEHAAHLPDREDTAPGGREAEQIGAVLELLDKLDLAGAANAAAADGWAPVRDALSRCAAELRGLSDTLTHHYFSHADTSVS